MGRGISYQYVDYRAIVKISWEIVEKAIFKHVVICIFYFYTRMIEEKIDIFSLSFSPLSWIVYYPI